MNSPTKLQPKLRTDGPQSNSSFPSQGKSRKRERNDHGSDGTQSNSSFPSQDKGRKREWNDHGSEVVKRVRSSRVDDSCSVPRRSVNNLRSQLAEITVEGRLVDSEGVEKLVKLMLSERSARNANVIRRWKMVGVLAATENFDCLSRFVQLRGLPILDEWLQQAQKEKTGGKSNPRYTDTQVENLILLIFRALGKLPVDLNALQTCNIGKSVNHLRSHKNGEIQKKARRIVDTWKRRVEAEMDVKCDSKQEASAARQPRTSDVPRADRHSGRSSDSTKASTKRLHGSKSAPVKVQVENNMKSIATSPSSTRSAQSPGSGVTSVKEGQHRNADAGAGDVLTTTVKDEKSSSSSQSHNISQSCSSKSAKTGSFSGKEDARSSTAGSKSSDGSSRHRKSRNGFRGSASSSAAHGEAGSSRSSSSRRNATPEKPSRSTSIADKIPEVPAAEGRNDKLIVKVQNCGRSPAQSVRGGGGPFEDPAPVNSRASSPVVSDQLDESDQKMREKKDGPNLSSDVIAESWQSNNLKDVLMGGSEEAAGSPPAVPLDHPCRTVDDSIKVANIVTATSLPSGQELKSARHGGSLSSMNALVESCVRYSDMDACVAGADDVGINLLASVAADEMSKSSPVSQLSNAAVIEEHTAGDVTKLVTSSSDSLSREKDQAVANDTDAENDEHHVRDSEVQPMDSDTVNDSKSGDLDESSNSEIEDLQRLVDQCLESDENSDDVAPTPISASFDNQKANVAPDVGGVSGLTTRTEHSELTRCEAVGISEDVDVLAVEHSMADVDGDSEKEQMPQTELTSKFVKTAGEDVSITAANAGSLIAEDINGVGDDHISPIPIDIPKNVLECDASMAVTKHVASALDSSVEHVKENLENSDVDEQCEGLSPEDAGDYRRLNGSRVSDSDGDEAQECTSVARDAVSSGPASTGSKMGARMEFDLNEGFNSGDSRIEDSDNVAGSVSLIPTPVEEVPLTTTSSGKQTKRLLDIDLNVPDESLLEELATLRSGIATDLTFGFSDNAGGRDLDLNRVDDPTNMNVDHQPEMLLQPSKVSSGGCRDFDLNDGPAVDDVNVESSMSFSQPSRNSLPSQPILPALGAKGDNMTSFSPWFPSGSSAYPHVAVPPILPDIRDQTFISNGGPERVMGPAMFQYPLLPFGTGFPFASTAFPGGSTMYMDSSLTSGRLCFPAANSQALGPPVAVPSSYPKPPYFMGLQNGGNRLDLNYGAGSYEGEGRRDDSKMGPRELAPPSTSLSLKEDQTRRY